MASFQCPIRHTSRTSITSTYIKSTTSQTQHIRTILPSSSHAFSTTSPTQKRDPGGNKRFGKRSTYQFRGPRFYRGPYHPHQPPAPHDPASREFIPGPFTSERLWDHYNDTIRADLLALSYTHLEPGHVQRKYTNRLRKWEGDSPYIENRPLRGPRGHSALPLVVRPITFRNVPRLSKIVVHAFVNQATKDVKAIPAAGMAVQAITGVRPTVVMARQTIGQWGLSAGKPIAVKVTLEGPSMYRFLASCVDIIMPKIKEYQGVSATTGDVSGNIGFGFDPTIVALFPEIEVNYDMYPSKFIPGIHVQCVTTATNDKDARLLLGGFGVPFHGAMKI